MSNSNESCVRIMRIPLCVLGAAILLIAVLPWVFYKKPCTELLNINPKYDTKSVLKLHIDSNNSSIIESIKSLQFQLPEGYRQAETSINDRKKIEFIFSAPSTLQFDPNVTKGIIIATLEKIEKGFCLTASAKPIHQSEVMQICLKPN